MKKVKLSQKKSARDRLGRNMLSSLVMYGEITTTEAKGKAVKTLAQKLIQLAKIENTSNRKRSLEKILYGKATEMFESQKYASVSNFLLDKRYGDGARKMLVKLNTIKNVANGGQDKKPKALSEKSKGKK